MNRLLDILMREGAGRFATSPASRPAASVPLPSLGLSASVVHWHRRGIELPLLCFGWAGGDSFATGPGEVTCPRCMGYPAVREAAIEPGLLSCDGCSRLRHDVRAVGRDGEGAADAPDLCGECREKMSGKKE